MLKVVPPWPQKSISSSLPGELCTKRMPAATPPTALRSHYFDTEGTSEAQYTFGTRALLQFFFTVETHLFSGLDRALSGCQEGSRPSRTIGSSMLQRLSNDFLKRSQRGSENRMWSALDLIPICMVGQNLI